MSQNIKYSIIRVIRRPGKQPLRFYARSPQGSKVFGFTAFRMLTRRYRKAGLEYEVVYHLPQLPSTHVSKNFTWAEFASNKNGSPCCKTVQVPDHLRGNAKRLAQGLEMLRALLGNEPLGLLSVYRTDEHNRHVHGASMSQHKSATAADLAVKAGDQARVVAAAKQVPAFKGIGIYPAGGVHVDVRPGNRVFWNDWNRS